MTLAKERLLQELYGVYAASGADDYTDSDEMARRLSIEREAIENAAAELRKEDLVSFEACDFGLVKLRLTSRGVEQIETRRKSE